MLTNSGGITPRASTLMARASQRAGSAMKATDAVCQRYQRADARLITGSTRLRNSPAAMTPADQRSLLPAAVPRSACDTFRH